MQSETSSPVSTSEPSLSSKIPRVARDARIALGLHARHSFGLHALLGLHALGLHALLRPQAPAAHGEGNSKRTGAFE